MVVNRFAARKIATGEITQHRLPRDKTPPRPERHLLIQAHQGADAHCVVRTLTITLSRDEDRRIAGHADTLHGDNLTQLGHTTVPSYAAQWLATHDRPWLSRHTPDDTLDLSAAAADLDEQIVMDRWEDRWASEPVWVIAWQVDSDQPLWLEKGGVGLTSIPSRGCTEAGEYQDPAKLKPHWDDFAKRRHARDRDKHAAANRIANSLRAA